MSPTRSAARAAVACLLWLALFSLLYTLGDRVGAWPSLPVGKLQGVDLVVGLAAGAALLVLLLRR